MDKKRMKRIAPAPAGNRIRKRGETRQTVTTVRRVCPRCGGKLIRIHRRPIDRLQSAFLPVNRFRCFTAPCGYETNIISWKRQPAGAERRLLVCSRLAAATVAGILTIGFGFYWSLLDPTPSVAAANFPRAEVQIDPIDAQSVITVEIAPRFQTWSIETEQQ
jgi:hypothetical protein